MQVMKISNKLNYRCY